MYDKKFDILEILREFPETSLTIHARDLNHFARQLLAEARQEFERERAIAAQEKTEDYLTSEMVKTLLRISESTLCRLAKTRILNRWKKDCVPVKVVVQIPDRYLSKNCTGTRPNFEHHNNNSNERNYKRKQNESLVVRNREDFDLPDKL